MRERDSSVCHVLNYLYGQYQPKTQGKAKTLEEAVITTFTLMVTSDHKSAMSKVWT